MWTAARMGRDRMRVVWQREETREDRDEMERRLKAELEEKARLDLSTKLADVNVFLDEQARARDRLDAMRDTNDAQQRRELQQQQHKWQVRGQGVRATTTQMAGKRTGS